MICMCGHPRRVHAQDGACNICWCFQFESSVVENPGAPHRIREEFRPAELLPEPIEVLQEVASGFSMPTHDD